jgi:hypothetical protein
MTKRLALTSNSQCMLAFLCLLSTFISGCGKKKQDVAETGMSGKFVNQTFLDAIPDSIPGLIPAYCFEMDFVSPDSVKIFYGFEEATLAYKKSGKYYVLIKAAQGKDMPFYVNKDQTITLADSNWTNLKTNSRFSKVLSNNGPEWDFETYLNRQMIAGNYILFKNDKPTGQKVSFQADGIVSGIHDFKTYSICYSGDCVGEVYPISNNITFLNSKNEPVTYAFVKSKVSQKLGLFNIEAPIKDMKGERAMKELVFDLRK